MLRTCLFDMGNVLVHFSHELMCNQMAALCDKTGEEVRSLLIDSGLQWDFERGQLTEAEFHARFCNVTEADVDFRALRKAGSDIFELNTPIVPVLDRLRELDIRLVLLSNTSVSHFEFIRERFDVLSRFDDFIVSYRVGAIKPERAIFEAAIAAIECEPDECFYTDDIPEYVGIGREFGLQAEVFTDAAALTGHLADRDVTI
jgi:HAD superfamily hydrolase (TIGR01549 family)